MGIMGIMGIQMGRYLLPRAWSNCLQTTKHTLSCYRSISASPTDSVTVLLSDSLYASTNFRMLTLMQVAYVGVKVKHDYSNQ
jgi:hypothetical protein